MTRKATQPETAARLALLLACAFSMQTLLAGEQQYEPLSASVQAVLHRSVADRARARLTFASQAEGAAWLADIGSRRPITSAAVPTFRRRGSR